MAGCSLICFYCPPNIVRHSCLWLLSWLRLPFDVASTTSNLRLVGSPLLFAFGCNSHWMNWLLQFSIFQFQRFRIEGDRAAELFLLVKPLGYYPNSEFEKCADWKRHWAFPTTGFSPALDLEIELKQIFKSSNSNVLDLESHYERRRTVARHESRSSAVLRTTSTPWDLQL